MKHEIMIPESAVLLITFNRSDNTREVFRQIKQAKIKKLYVANDGPREGNENDIIERERIKLLLQEVDWDCELHTLFQEKNLGVVGDLPLPSLGLLKRKIDLLF